MDTHPRRRRGTGRLGAALGAALLATLPGCAGGQAPHPDASAAAATGDGTSGFDEVVAAVQKAKIALCTPADGGGYVPLPAPVGQAAAAASYFRYLDGRIYQFGPCELSPSHRNELRLFRYADAATRDAAIREMTGRHLRPTSAFAVDDAYEAQIWSPDPSLEGPVGQTAAAVHSALGHMEHAHHLDVGP